MLERIFVGEEAGLWFCCLQIISSLTFSSIARNEELLAILTKWTGVSAWQNSRHVARSPLVSPQNDVWGTNAKFPADGASLPTFGLCLILIGLSKFSTNQWHEFLRLFLRCHFAGKPLVASRNVSCFLRLLSRDALASLSLWLYGCVIGWTFRALFSKKMTWQQAWLDNKRRL